MTTWLLIVLVVLGALVVVAELTRQAVATHRHRFAREVQVGNDKLRRRMRGLVGRRHHPSTMDTVVAAETMRGWVWVAMTRRSRQPFVEDLGWAPFQWVARRRLTRYRAS